MLFRKANVNSTDRMIFCQKYGRPTEHVLGLSWKSTLEPTPKRWDESIILVMKSHLRRIKTTRHLVQLEAEFGERFSVMW